MTTQTFVALVATAAAMFLGLVAGEPGLGFLTSLVILLGIAFVPDHNYWRNSHE